MRRKTVWLGAMLLVLGMLSAAGIQAQVPPNLISFQGMLTDAAGAPVSFSKDFTFRIYDVPSSGAPLWSETQLVTVTDGHYHVLLGSASTTPPDFATILNGSERYLAVQIEGEAEMTPRLRIGSAPYAMLSTSSGGGGGANTLDGAYDQGGAGAGRVITADAGAVQINGSALKLQVAGGNWDVGSTDGDFRIGNDTYHLEVGVATAGGGAGDIRVRAEGGQERLLLGSGAVNTLALKGKNVGIGTITPQHRIHVYNAQDVRCGYFHNFLGTTQYATLEATTNGLGAAVKGINSSATQRPGQEFQNGGSAGHFEITNTGNYQPAIFAKTVGFGPGAKVISTHSNGVGLDAVSTGAASTALVANNAGSSGNIAIFQNNYSNRARIDRTGRGFFNGGTQTGGADVAEAFEVEGAVDAYEPGDVLVISTDADRQVALSGEPYSTLVAGVYATKAGVLLTERDIDDDLSDMVPMGMVGVIPTKVTGENGPIRRGDLLVTASTPGHAMKGTDRERMLGAVIGKALEEFEGQGAGVIRVLVNVK